MTEFERRARALVEQMTLEEKISQLLFNAPAIDRLGVPAYNWWNEALHGVARAGAATVFPQAIGLAASFDEEGLRQTAEMIAEEARAKYNAHKKNNGGNTAIYHGLTCWSPNINIFRDPRWGRGHETYGEDPCLTGRMGAAFVKGMQGEGEYRKTDATLKHYAVHSGPEGLRHGFNAQVSKKDLYETYLAAFQYCIDNASPAAVMGAYNRVDGEVCCGSKTLLEEILRGEFGFDGYVVSDCGAICDFHEHHHVTKDKAESAALALNNGCQLNCGDAYSALHVAYFRGLISEETVTEAAVKLFTARYRLGMFDRTSFDDVSFDVVECDAHRAQNLKMAHESIVLLKNDGLLPLKPGCRVAVIGPNADNRGALVGNYNGVPSDYYTPLRGIGERARVTYAEGCRLFSPDEKDMGYSRADAVDAALNADVAVLCLGLDGSLEGEEGDGYNSDCSGDKPDLRLPKLQNELLQAICETGKPVVCVDLSGSAIDLRYAQENCGAVLQCFYPGAMGGKALADVLFGDVSPSGRLPLTFYHSADDLPAFDDYAMADRTYRYYKGEPLYPFGWGLGYSPVRYENVKKIAADGKDAVTADLTNEGTLPQRAVTLLFAHVRDSRTETPVKQLCAFGSEWLSPGETKTVTLTPEEFWTAAVLPDGTRTAPDGGIRYSLFTGQEALNVE